VVLVLSNDIKANEANLFDEQPLEVIGNSDIEKTNEKDMKLFQIWTEKISN